MLGSSLDDSLGLEGCAGDRRIGARSYEKYITAYLKKHQISQKPSKIGGIHELHIRSEHLKKPKNDVTNYQKDQLKPKLSHKTQRANNGMKIKKDGVRVLV